MRRGIALIGFIIGFLLTSCSTSENFSFHPRAKQVVKSSPTASYIWQPEYYVYKRGKYKFVSGGYRPVISRKNYFKRSLKGFTYKGDYAAAR